MKESLDNYLASLTSDIEAFCGVREWDRVRALVCGFDAVVEFASAAGIITKDDADSRINELSDYLDAVGCPCD